MTALQHTAEAMREYGLNETAAALDLLEIELRRLYRIEAAARELMNCHTGAPWQTDEVKNKAFRALSGALGSAPAPRPGGTGPGAS